MSAYDPLFDESDLDVPEYRCVHGTFIGNPYGGDYMCGACEDGISWEDYQREMTYRSNREIRNRSGTLVGHTHPGRHGDRALQGRFQVSVYDACFDSMDDLKAANARLGHHFFDAPSMRFFGSDIESDLITLRDGRQFFVTTERFTPSDGMPLPPEYTIRRAHFPSGQVTTQGDFQQYPTKHDALQAIAKMHHESRRLS